MIRIRRFHRLVPRPMTTVPTEPHGRERVRRRPNHMFHPEARTSALPAFPYLPRSDLALHGWDRPQGLMPPAADFWEKRNPVWRVLRLEDRSCLFARGSERQTPAL